jgi:hypothetical protein
MHLARAAVAFALTIACTSAYATRWQQSSGVTETNATLSKSQRAVGRLGLPGPVRRFVLDHLEKEFKRAGGRPMLTVGTYGPRKSPSGHRIALALDSAERSEVVQVFIPNVKSGRGARVAIEKGEVFAGGVLSRPKDQPRAFRIEPTGEVTALPGGQRAFWLGDQ